MLRQALLIILMAAVTIFMFYLLSRLVDIKKLFDTLLSISPAFFILIMLLEAAIVLLMAKRYQVILGHMGSHVPYHRCLSVNMAAYPLVSVTPSISGNFIKVLYLRGESPPSMVASSVIAERLFDLAVLAVLVLFGLALSFNLEFFIIALLVIAMLVLFMIIARRISGKFKKSILRKLNDVIQVIAGLFRDIRSAFNISMYSLAIWAIALAQIYLFFIAVDARIPFLSVLANMPIAMMIGQIPVTIGGMGTRDGVMVELFKGVMSNEQILAAGFMFSVFRYWVPAFTGLFFMIHENRAVFNKKGKQVNLGQ